ncbi:PREDICTED: ankyrin repeat and fibronectin type-III domain-containing protein 1-like [Priapulus caudatus]|uniref:Ankyrin repeat and fibronectin type-III domain-containing protein 1-like n=1 Tax=Priapulus caudatus TaxID=37621 RepID=A0ABM1E6S8_PRICU|nr:PREDICTED: ankyrin repeat and fibronectin type-III domain-containing protein 1-like [Priapulus caudatus]
MDFIANDGDAVASLLASRRTIYLLMRTAARHATRRITAASGSGGDGVGKSRALDLSQLIKDAEEKTNDLTNAILNTTPGSTALIKEIEKQLDFWEWKTDIAKQMKAAYDHANAPDPPTDVSLTVSSPTSLLVRFQQPEDCNGALVTWYKGNA